LADTYHFTIERLLKPVRELWVLRPGIVLSAFASETYLKCLLHLEKGNAPRTHDLHKLFLKLKPETQDQLAQRWQRVIAQQSAELDERTRQMGRPIPRDLPGALRVGSNAFVELRYLWQETPSTMFILSDLPGVLRSAILDRQQAWGP
jgi:hypothetical protein